jgi:predicted nucleic acid-binding protein
VKIIPDSSFFICFLDDLEGHLPITDRLRVLTVITENFPIMIVPAVEQESRFQRLPTVVSDQIQRITITGLPTDSSIELLRPLLGKGEHEVITYARICLLKGDCTFLFILDDGVARDLVKRMLPVLVSHMKGTAGFLGFCAIRKVLEKNETINLLTIIGRSKFRVDRSTISTVIAEVQNRCS